MFVKRYYKNLKLGFSALVYFQLESTSRARSFRLASSIWPAGRMFPTPEINCITDFSINYCIMVQCFISDRFARRKLKKFQRKNSKRSSSVGLDVGLKVSEMRRRVETDQDLVSDEDKMSCHDNNMMLIENCSYGDYITCSKGFKQSKVNL